mgnify:CR=1 FL=1
MSTLKIPDLYGNLWFSEPTPIYERFSYGLKMDELSTMYEDIFMITRVTGQGTRYERFKVYDPEHDIKAKL